MRFPKVLSSIPEKVYILAFLAIIVLSSAYTYFQAEDTFALEKKIASRQKEFDRTVMLKDMYLAKKKNMEGLFSKGTEEKTASLGLIEELASKTFIAGKLTMLKPSTAREEKGKTQVIFELKVGGAALGEVIAFVKGIEASGLYVKKLQLNISASNPTFLDMYTIITAG